MFSFRNGFYFQISCSGFNFVSDFSAWGGIMPGRGRGAWSRGRLRGLAPVGFNVCCPELRQEPALLRVLRKRNSSGKASSDAGPELAGRESCVAMESPQALMCPLEKGINKSSSDDRPGPGICDSKYVEDAKAARSVRVWDRVPMKNTRLGGLR